MKTVIIIVLIIVFALAYISGSYLNSRTIYVEYTPEEKIQEVKVSYGPNVSSVTMFVPAIDKDGNGVITRINVQAMPGSGKTLTNIDNILFWVDTQNSIRLAKHVAQNVTKMDLNDFDLVYTITANASVVEGPSAGSAIAITTIAALENKTINPDIMITGSVDENGVIGPVGGIIEKIEVAKENNVTMFLVPSGHIPREGNYVREKDCKEINGTQICEIDYVLKKADLKEKFGIEVIEVENIEEAVKHFM